MSYPSPLRSAGDVSDHNQEGVELPNEFYVYTALMIGLVVAIAFLYRQLWVSVWASVRYYRRPTHLRGGPAGCKPVGRRGDRNLSKEASKLAIGEEGVQREAAGKIKALFVYPIKSCYPVEVESSLITETGFEYDRQFCFASWHEPPDRGTVRVTDAKKGSGSYWDNRPHWEFMTQRQNPSLKHLKVQIWQPDPDLKDYSENAEYVKSGGCLIISFAFAPPLTSLPNIWSAVSAKIRAFSLSAVPTWTFHLPLNPTPEQIHANNYTSDTVRIWRDAVPAIDMTSELPKDVLSALQSLFLGDLELRSPSKYAQQKKNPPKLRLFRVDNLRHRDVYKCAPTEAQLGYQAHTGFSDSYPIHIQNLASIADVEKQIPTGKAFRPDSRRFRANVLVAGPTPYDEDDWTLIALGNHQLHVSCRTTRCKLPTNDPDTGVLGSDVQPYKHLQKYRVIDEGSPTGCLGMMCVPTKEAIGVTIKVGDHLEVLRRGKHRFVADAEPEAQRPVL